VRAGKCILAWAVQKDPPWCPQCKAPFTRLVTYRALDGTLSDFPAEESVCLLKRACWFQAHLRVRPARPGKDQGLALCFLQPRSAVWLAVLCQPALHRELGTRW